MVADGALGVEGRMFGGLILGLGLSEPSVAVAGAIPNDGRSPAGWRRAGGPGPRVRRDGRSSVGPGTFEARAPVVEACVQCVRANVFTFLTECVQFRAGCVHFLGECVQFWGRCVQSSPACVHGVSRSGGLGAGCSASVERSPRVVRWARGREVRGERGQDDAGGLGLVARKTPHPAPKTVPASPPGETFA